MAEVLFDVYTEVAGNLSKRLCTFSTVDVLANDRSDYKSIFQLESLKLQNRFRELHGFNANAEHRYVCKSLWHSFRDTFKARRRRYEGMVSHEGVMLMVRPPASTEKLELEYRIEARNAVKILEKFLLPEEMKLLWRWVFRDCRMEAGIQPGMSKRQVKYRIGLLRDKAKKILKK